MRFYTVLLATTALMFLGQLSEDLGIVGHAVWWSLDDSKAPYGYVVLVYLAAVVIVGLVYEIGRWHGRR